MFDDSVLLWELTNTCSGIGNLILPFLRSQEAEVFDIVPGAIVGLAGLLGTVLRTE